MFAARPVGKSVDFAVPDADKNEAFLTADKTFFLDNLGEPAFGRPDLVGIAFYQGMAIRADLSEDLVYRMTKALYEKPLGWVAYKDRAVEYAEKSIIGYLKQDVTNVGRSLIMDFEKGRE